MIVYFHGLGADSHSKKAQILKSMIKNEYLFMPEYDDLKPWTLYKMLEPQLKNEKELIFIGSSAGGYYARMFAQKYQANALLINPVIDALASLKHIHKQTPPDFKTEFKQFKEAIGSATYKASFELGLGCNDEVLSYEESIDFFKRHRLLIYDDDHCFVQSFPNFLKISHILKEKHFI